MDIELWKRISGFVDLNSYPELPCPHCGFDATWYKRDVKVARRQVLDFWNRSEDPKEAEDKIPAEVVAFPHFDPKKERVRDVASS